MWSWCVTSAILHEAQLHSIHLRLRSIGKKQRTHKSWEDSGGVTAHVFFLLERCSTWSISSPKNGKRTSCWGLDVCMCLSLECQDQQNHQTTRFCEFQPKKSCEKMSFDPWKFVIAACHQTSPSYLFFPTEQQMDTALKVAPPGLWIMIYFMLNHAKCRKCWFPNFSACCSSKLNKYPKKHWPLLQHASISASSCNKNYHVSPWLFHVASKDLTGKSWVCFSDTAKKKKKKKNTSSLKWWENRPLNHPK